jgi:cyclopropane fatty-acyl-phospholipid synthase-like methyltransferase
MLAEELLAAHPIPPGSFVCDLGSGQGLTSVFLAREFGLRVVAADLWSDPDENRRFFEEMGVADLVSPVRADATALPFAPAAFDAVVSFDSYNYFGRDPAYLDARLLPFVKPGGLVLLAVPGMKRDLHAALPPELLLSWTPEQLDYLHDVPYWTRIVSACRGADVLSVAEMATNAEAWADWLTQENPYALNDRRSMSAGAGQYLNFVSIALQKHP